MKYRKHGFFKGPRGLREKQQMVSKLFPCKNEACKHFGKWHAGPCAEPAQE